MATYVIGDVHGRLTELQQLLRAIKFNSRADQLWFTGDLVDSNSLLYGHNQSIATLEFISALSERAICVLGNHDLTLLYHAFAASSRSATAATQQQQILSEPLLQWLCSRPLLHYDAKFNTLLVHAGLAPQWTTSQALSLAREVEKLLTSTQAAELFIHLFGDKPDLWCDELTSWDRVRCIINFMTRIRFCSAQGELNLTAKGSAADAPPGTMPWFNVPERKTKDINIVFGHWAALNGKTNCNNVFALDTGCYWGNKLTALRLEDRQRITVSCD